LAIFSWIIDKRSFYIYREIYYYKFKATKFVAFLFGLTIPYIYIVLVCIQRKFIKNSLNTFQKHHYLDIKISEGNSHFEFDELGRLLVLTLHISHGPPAWRSSVRGRAQLDLHERHVFVRCSLHGAGLILLTATLTLSRI